jgi:hypothetical protein
MRKVLRHAVTEIIHAGREIEQIDQGGGDVEIYTYRACMTEQGQQE